MYGATTSSAAARIAGRSIPVAIPSRSKTAARTSVGALPGAGAEAHGSQPSIWRAPARSARTELATPRTRLLWPWKPTCASAPTSATSAATRSRASSEDQRAGGVDDVGALAAGVDHDPRLRGQLLRARHVAEHQKADRLQAELARGGEVLDRDVGLGAVGGDPHDVAPRLGGALAGRRRCPTPGTSSTAIARCWPPRRAAAISVISSTAREAVVEGRAAEPVAVGRPRSPARRRRRARATVARTWSSVNWCAIGVAAVAQRRVGDPHPAASCAVVTPVARRASRSPTSRRPRS